MIKKIRANAVPIVLIAISGLFIVDINKQGNDQAIGLAFPRIIIILLLISAVLLVLRTLLVDGKKIESKENENTVKMHWPVLISFLIYIVLLNILGFFICTPIFIFVCTKLFKINTGQSILTSVILTAAIYLLFIKVLFVPFPSGIWIFREINRFIIY